MGDRPLGYNLRVYREQARSLIPHYFEVFVNTPLDTCVGRDPKGIYKKGHQGASATVPGLQAEYEEPLRPDVGLDGQNQSPDAGARRVVRLLVEAGLLAPQI